MLNTDRQSHVSVRNTGGNLVFRHQLGMRGRDRMDSQAARVSNILHVVEHLQCLNKGFARFLPAGQFEPDETAELDVLIVGDARKNQQYKDKPPRPV
jgi:hypothetical protein